ncbi:MAG: ParB/RepB/Spo0J family partition protein [Candidatus Cloacimonetes bacterium]|nr:ParB/RepB/Spo0J family partition protein [Candidatus Cloacimonadota bacterium]
MNKTGKFTQKGKEILKAHKPGTIADFLEAEQDSERKIHEMEIASIQANPWQPRQHIDPKTLSELSDSIRQYGVIQPILVRRANQGEIVLVAGQRRLQASKLAGLKTVPVIFTDGNPLEIALIENLQRENLSPIEEAEALARMVSEFNYTQEQVARVIGKARSTISESLSLTRLPEEIKTECRRADIPKRSLVEIAKQGSEKDMLRLFRQLQARTLKSDAVRAITRVQRQKPQMEKCLEKIRAVARELENLKVTNLQEKEYLELVEELSRLKGIVDGFLS